MVNVTDFVAECAPCQFDVANGIMLIGVALMFLFFLGYAMGQSAKKKEYESK